MDIFWKYTQKNDYGIQTWQVTPWQPVYFCSPSLLMDYPLQNS